MERYRTLEEIYTTYETFVEELAPTIRNKILMSYSYLPYSTVELDNIMLGIVTPILYVIFEYYYSDKISYPFIEDDTDKLNFEKRLTHELSVKLPSYIVKFNFQDIIKTLNTDRYDITSHMISSSKEKGVSGSSVIQSSASTPTGVSSEETGDTISITKEGTETTSSVTIDEDTFSGKFTNYQAKTNGMHDNDVNRNGSVTRKGSLLDIINLVNNLPQSFYDIVLKDVVKHFIFLY